jgi:glycerol dehydrogenase
MLEEQPPEIIEPVVRFCRDVGLPTTLAQIGLNAKETETLTQIAESAIQPGGLIHNEPFEVTSAQVLDALRTADDVGNQS